MSHNFQSDYVGEPHPAVMQAMISYLSGSWKEGVYGEDDFCTEAKIALRNLFKVGPDAGVFFVPNGSAANRLALATLLPRSFHAVMCADFAHINVHECGSIASLGHPIIPLQTGRYGKIGLDQVLSIAERMRPDIHQACPTVVSIANVTEIGTVYRHEELVELGRKVSDRGLKLHFDGARVANVDSVDLGCILNEYRFSAVSFGLAKNGAEVGDVVVIADSALVPDATRLHKQFGYLSPRMHRYGVQALALLQDSVWSANGKKATCMAKRLEQEFRERIGIPHCIGPSFPVESNAFFVSLPNDVVKKVMKQKLGIVWHEGKQTSTLRFMCSWSTSDTDVEALVSTIRSCW